MHSPQNQNWSNGVQRRAEEIKCDNAVDSIRCKRKIPFMRQIMIAKNELLNVKTIQGVNGTQADASFASVR